MTDVNKYAIENLPITEETYKELTQENIYYLGVVGRMLSVQDNANEEYFDEKDKHDKEQFDKILLSLSDISKSVCDLKVEVATLRIEVSDLKKQLSEITAVVDETKIEVERLKMLNSTWAIMTRIGIGVALALGLMRLIHGKF